MTGYRMPVRCRACFTEYQSGEEFYSVDGLVSIDAEERKLALSVILETCIGIKPPELPPNTFVCKNCYNKLIEFYKFKISVMDTHGKYNQLMDELKIKIELVDNDTDDPLDREPDLDDGVSVKSDPESKPDSTDTKPAESSNIQVGKVPTQGSRTHFRRQWDKLGFKKNAKGEYPCPHCPGVFYRPSHLCDHIIWKHSNQSIFSCEFCGLIFDAYPPLKRHVRDSHIKKPFTCDLCDAQYEIIATLRTHMRLKHVNGGSRVSKKMFACNKCAKVFTESSNYRRHMSRKHNEGHEVRPYVCNKCGKSWRNAFELQLHERSKHSESRDFVCDLCGKAFKTPNYLKTHHTTVHSEKRDICCDQCGKKFKTTTILKAHYETHYTDKRFICQICNTAFKQKSTLTAHLAQHKDKMSGIIFRCEYCSKILKNRTSLLHHIRLHNGKDLPCKHCDKIYKNPDSLKRHIQSNHQGVKWRHVCLICDKDLWDKNQIVNHVGIDHKKEIASSGKKAEEFVKRIKIEVSGQNLEGCEKL